jgi:thiamine biosynthesis lipoprotein ApbE
MVVTSTIIDAIKTYSVHGGDVKTKVSAQLLNDLKEKKRYWKLKEEALDITVWRTRFRKS